MNQYLKMMQEKKELFIAEVQEEGLIGILYKYHFMIFFGLSFSAFLIVMGISALIKVGSSEELQDAGTEQYTTAVVQQETSAVSQYIQEQTSIDAQGNAIITEIPVGTDEQGNVIADPNAGQIIQVPVGPTMPAVAYHTADVSYFDDALFIGDSRTIAMQMYGGLTNTTFYVDTGMSIWKVLNAPIANVNGQQMSVDAALQATSFNKIYIMLGINEVGTGTAETFAAQYQSVIARIKELQPQAIIYIQSIMHVTQAQDEKGTLINNAEINNRNARLMRLADGVSTFWIDENEIFDEPGTGVLNAEYTGDGIHLKARYVAMWRDYLLQHVILR